MHDGDSRERRVASRETMARVPQTREPIKQFFSIFLPAALIVCVGAWLIARSSIETAENVVLQRDVEQVSLARSRLQGELARPIDHIQSLVQEGMVREVYRAPPGTSSEPMENAFRTLLTRNPGYSSVRWIGEDGRERVKVQRAGDEIVVAPASDLQDMKGRYFFKEAISQPAGQVYVSPMDLLVDRNGIVVPHVPDLPDCRAGVRSGRRGKRYPHHQCLCLQESR